MAEYITSIDIANRALVHVGASPNLVSFTGSKNAVLAGFLYDKVRAAELREHLWKFAITSAVLFPQLPTTLRFDFPNWSVSTTYPAGSVVISNGLAWINTAPQTGGTAPAITNGQPANDGWGQVSIPTFATPFVLGTRYPSGSLATDGTSVFYALPGATGQPLTQPLAWVNQHVVAASTFTLVGSAGAYTDGTQKSNFPQPVGMLRLASQDPRQQGTVHLSTTGGIQYSDFEIENGALLSSLPGPIVLRFTYDDQNVLTFDPMFGEALAARLAVAMAPAITQNAQKIQQAQGIYNDLVSRARRLDAIEAGNQEPDEAEVHFERLGEMSPQAVAARAQGGRRG